MFRRAKGPLAFVLISAPSVMLAWGPEVVSVSASATDTYVSRKFAKSETRPESYVFYEGKFFPGATADGSLYNFTFSSITHLLAQHLVKQKYFPAASLKEADLLITVNWGVTIVEDDTELNRAAKTSDALNAFNASGAANARIGAGIDSRDAATSPSLPAPDYSSVNMQLMENEMERENIGRAIDRNAKLLGYTVSGSNAEENLYELSEERYFMILLAYDAHALKKGVKPEPLWSMRLSMRSPGHNFTEAAGAMGIAAREYFGKQVDGLQHKEIGKGKASVTVGKEESLGEAK